MNRRIPTRESFEKHRRTHPFTVWEGKRGGAARGFSYRTRLQAIVAAWWASVYSGHDVWIERDMPRAVFVPQTGPHGPAGDSGANL